MDLLEYQAKELFREMGIPVLPSQRIDQPQDLKGLKIPYPVVLKSQVRAGGRGKAGGVKFVETTIDAVAAAQTIFNLSIQGEYPEVILAEAKYNADQEFYLAVVLDTIAKRPVLLGSKIGGIDIEAVMEQMQMVIVDREFSPFYARRLALKMGLQGHLIQAVSHTLEQMYRLFVEKDLDLVEINPLGVSASGEVMALDGKVTVNDEAIERHLDLKHWLTLPKRPIVASRAEGEEVRLVLDDSLKLVEFPGNIGVLCNGTGLMMATVDLIYKAGGKPGTVLTVGGEAQGGWTAQALCDRIERGLELMTKDKNVKVLLVNILSSVAGGECIANAIAQYLTRRARDTRSRSEIQVVLRLLRSELPAATEVLTSLPVSFASTLDESVRSAVSLAKHPKSSRNGNSKHEVHQEE